MIKDSKNFLFIFFAISFVLFPTASFADVSKIEFTTEPQSVKPGEISGPITIQTQDSSGNPFQTPETIDLQFVSSSPTGEFLGSTGNPATTYMSKNTANRTFYYKDSAEGEFTITVKATGRDSGQSWQTSQRITVSAGAAGNPPGEVLAVNTELNPPPQSSQSATAGAVAPSYSTPGSQLEVSTGGDRLTSPGSPISFQARIMKNSASNSAVDFQWSYGDGSVGKGALVSHMYKYPGDYAVILNARAGNIFAVSRFKVRVIEPDISLIDTRDYVELANNSIYEINLFNWKIISENRGFIFQPDTIVLPKSVIKIDKSLFLMKGEAETGTILKNYLGQIVASGGQKQPNLEDITLQTKEIEKQAYSLVNKAITAKVVTEKAPKSSIRDKEEKPENAPAAPVLEEEVDEGNVIYEAPKNEGIFHKAWNFLVSVLN